MKDLDLNLKLVDLAVAGVDTRLPPRNVNSHSVITSDGQIEIPRLNYDNSIRLSEDFECMQIRLRDWIIRNSSRLDLRLWFWISDESKIDAPRITEQAAGNV